MVVEREVGQTAVHEGQKEGDSVKFGQLDQVEVSRNLARFLSSNHLLSGQDTNSKFLFSFSLTHCEGDFTIPSQELGILLNAEHFAF